MFTLPLKCSTKKKEMRGNSLLNLVRWFYMKTRRNLSNKRNKGGRRVWLRKKQRKKNLDSKSLRRSTIITITITIIINTRRKRLLLQLNMSQPMRWNYKRNKTLSSKTMIITKKMMTIRNEYSTCTALKGKSTLISD